MGQNWKICSFSAKNQIKKKEKEMVGPWLLLLLLLIAQLFKMSTDIPSVLAVLSSSSLFRLLFPWHKTNFCIPPLLIYMPHTFHLLYLLVLKSCFANISSSQCLHLLSNLSMLFSPLLKPSTPPLSTAVSIFAISLLII